MPPNAGWKKPSAAPKQAARTITAVRFTWPVTSTMKKTATTTARARSDEIISSRREYRSARTPPQSSVASIATDSAASTKPSEPADFVSAVTRQPTAIDERRVADERDRLAAPEQPEIAARERRERRLARSPSLPAALHRGRLSSPDGTGAAGGRLRRRLHARQAGPRSRPRGLPDARPAVRPRPRPEPLRRGAPGGRRARSSGTPSSTTTRRSGCSSPSGSCRGWAAAATRAARAAEMTAAWSHAEHFELYDDALPTLELLRGARAEARAALEHRPPPAELRGASRPARRRAAHLARARQGEAAREHLRAHARAARRRRRRGGDGRRHARGRHPRRARRSGCARCSSTATGATRTRRGASRAWLALPDALGLDGDSAVDSR